MVLMLSVIHLQRFYKHSFLDFLVHLQFKKTDIGEDG